MKTLIKNGHVIDPAQDLDGDFDVLISDGVIEDVFVSGSEKVSDAEEIDASGCIVAPGFIDLHTHLREPGFEYKETIQSGAQSAVFGGFTSICCMANTKPVNDSKVVTEFILKQAEDAACRVYPIGAITKGLSGEELAEMGEMKRSGIVAVSDDGLTVQNAALMRMGMEYAKTFDLPVTTHSIDADLAKKGHMNESFVSTKLGIPGSPAVAEDVIIARDIMLSELTGAHLHVGHLSTKKGLELVAEAKARGLNVTCEVTPHHFTLSDEDMKPYDTNYKMCPPLRGPEDVIAIREAFQAGGIIDAIATDHAPHGVIDKEVEFDQAAFGIIGFETALPLSLQLVQEGFLTLTEMIRLLTARPAEVFSLPGGSLKEGSPADLVVFNAAEEWVYKQEGVVSKSQNSPFLEQTLRGKVKLTLVNGQKVYQDQQEKHDKRAS